MVNQGNISTLLRNSRISTLHTADGAQLKKVFEYANFQRISLLEGKASKYTVLKCTTVQICGFEFVPEVRCMFTCLPLVARFIDDEAAHSFISLK